MGSAILPGAAQIGGGALAGSAFGPVGTAIGAIGGAIGAFGTYEGMQSQSANAAFQAQVAANSAAIARTNYKLQIESGEGQVANREMELRSQVGTQKAGQAASGIDVNSGSAAASRAGTAEVGTLDALTIRSNAARAAYGYSVAATGDTAESELLTRESQQASSMAPIAATGSLLSSYSTLGKNYGQYANAGGNPAFGTGSSAGAIY
jgi:hypothetical protein